MKFSIGRCASTIGGAGGSVLMMALLGCSPPEDSKTAAAVVVQQPAPSPPPAKVEEVVQKETPAMRGRGIFMANCIACHNVDPNLAGVIGPPIAGSKRELVESKVLRSEYPEGYEPKRDTRAMIPLPHLEPEIDAIVAFLAEAETATP